MHNGAETVNAIRTSIYLYEILRVQCAEPNRSEIAVYNTKLETIDAVRQR